MTAKQKKRRKKGQKSKKWMIFVLLLIALIGIVIVSLHFQKPSQSPKYLAKEYFRISDAIALATPTDAENKTIKIKQLDFKLTPIMGDANHVVVILSGGVEAQDYPYFREIKKNETICLAESGQEIIFKFSVTVTRSDEGYYPLTIRLRCDETIDSVEGQKVTIYISKWIAT